jgi:pimeloyl-ACP methyl ester carboxylesterase
MGTGTIYAQDTSSSKSVPTLAPQRRERGEERLITIGRSIGGSLALLTWRRHSDQVAGLVLRATARHFVPRNLAREARSAFRAAAGMARNTDSVGGI